MLSTFRDSTSFRKFLRIFEVQISLFYKHFRLAITWSTFVRSCRCSAKWNRFPPRLILRFASFCAPCASARVYYTVCLNEITISWLPIWNIFIVFSHVRERQKSCINHRQLRRGGKKKWGRGSRWGYYSDTWSGNNERLNVFGGKKCERWQFFFLRMHHLSR